jgi:hypothetical protein
MESFELGHLLDGLRAMRMFSTSSSTDLGGIPGVRCGHPTADL